MKIAAPAGRNFTLLVVALLVLGIGAGYSGSFAVGFYFDDAYGIVNNPSIKSLRNIPSFFTDPHAYWTEHTQVDVRPVLLITYAVNYAISGLQPWSYHVINRDRARYPTAASYLGDWRRLAPPVLLLGALDVAYIGYRAAVLSDWTAEAMHAAWVTPWIWFMSQWPALLYYVRLFLWPDALSVDHDFPYTTSLLLPRAWLSLLVLLTWSVLALRASRRYPHVTFATLWFFITLAPESSFAALAKVINDHRPYIASSLGLSVLLAWLLDRATTIVAPQAGRAAFAGAWLSPCRPAAVFTHYRSWQWTDSLRLWDDTVRKSPNNTRGWMNAGLVYMSRGDMISARRYFERAREL